MIWKFVARRFFGLNHLNKKMKFLIIFSTIFLASLRAETEKWLIAPGIQDAKACTSMLSIFSTILKIYPESEINMCHFSGECVFSVISINRKGDTIFIVGPEYDDLKISLWCNDKIVEKPFTLLKVQAWGGKSEGGVIVNDKSRNVEEKLGYFIHLDDEKKYKLTGSNKFQNIEMSWVISKAPGKEWVTNKIVLEEVNKVEGK